MFCPLCKCEYRQGFTTCADCAVALVAEIPAGLAPEGETGTIRNTLVPVLETHNQDDIAIIKSVLEAEGIIYHFSGESFHMMGVKPLPARLLVPSDRREEVLAMLREFECGK